MHISSQDRRSINDTIEHWDHSTYNNPILNLIWQLLPGFILWKIWKERNKRIFHSQPSKPETAWETIRSLIKKQSEENLGQKKICNATQRSNALFKTCSPYSTSNWGKNFRRIHRLAQPAGLPPQSTSSK
jgi:hypothetical protein